MLKWPEAFLHNHGSNSAILEVIGLLLPFQCIARELANQSILLLTDNQAVVYAWQKRMAPH
jgi:hypothetical protein